MRSGGIWSPARAASPDAARRDASGAAYLLRNRAPPSHIPGGRARRVDLPSRCFERPSHRGKMWAEPGRRRVCGEPCPSAEAALGMGEGGFPWLRLAGTLPKSAGRRAASDRQPRMPDELSSIGARANHSGRGGPYDLIVSISTLEHVGYDEEPRDSGKAARAVDNLRGLLSAGGEMLATIPIGYNRELDDALRDGSLGAQVSYLARVGELRWKQIDVADSHATHGWPWPGAEAVYGWPWPGANLLAVARWRSAD